MDGKQEEEMKNIEEEDEEVEMTYEELLIYAARFGEIEDVQFCIDEKVDLNTTTDKSGNTALRKTHTHRDLLYRHGMCQWSLHYC